MANHSLLSVGQLCNEGYIVTFKNASVTIFDAQEFQIMSSARYLDTILWRINLRKDNQHLQQSLANNFYELRNTGALVHYLHKALFSPTKSALLQAVKNGHLITLPRLTEEAINKYLKLTPAKAVGHIVKLLPLLQPPIRSCTDTRTNTSAQRATQIRSVLARVYAVSIQNQITATVP
jgi:hypothetical protein